MYFDFEKAREEIPGCRHVIHFNNAGAALLPRPVIDEMHVHLKTEAEIGRYEAQEQSLKKIQGFYQAAARLINCSAEEIAYSESATRAWDMVFHAVHFKPGDRILTARAEYGSNYLSFLQLSKARG